MSGLEALGALGALGALASAAQLVAYVLKTAAFLSDVYERLKHAPQRIQKHASDIKRLIDIILHIKENQTLHTTIVFTQLIHIISAAYNLQELLIKVLGQYTQPSLRKRYWKILKGNKERAILDALQDIERAKSGLSLCLTAAQTEYLHDVRREVRMLSRTCLRKHSLEDFRAKDMYSEAKTQ
jgi:predicted Zn-ribbon and HTH transcriptional regulator